MRFQTYTGVLTSNQGNGYSRVEGAGHYWTGISEGEQGTVANGRCAAPLGWDVSLRPRASGVPPRSFDSARRTADKKSRRRQTGIGVAVALRATETKGNPVAICSQPAPSHGVRRLPKDATLLRERLRGEMCCRPQVRQLSAAHREWLGINWASPKRAWRHSSPLRAPEYSPSIR